MGQDREGPRVPAGADHGGGIAIEIELKVSHSRVSGFASMRFEDLLYRPCVGIMVLNATARLSSAAASMALSNTSTRTHDWQMPQGGIDEGEEAYPARCASCSRKPTSARSRRSPRYRSGCTTIAPKDIANHAWKGRLSRPEAEVVRAALYREKNPRSIFHARADTSRSSSHGGGSR